MIVCEKDGVELGETKNGRLIHLGEIPVGIDPEHPIVPIDPIARETELDALSALTLALSDLLRHHDALCPPTACPFASQSRLALGRPS